MGPPRMPVAQGAVGCPWAARRWATGGLVPAAVVQHAADVCCARDAFDSLQLLKRRVAVMLAVLAVKAWLSAR
jgi:hypothetical protein